MPGYRKRKQGPKRIYRKKYKRYYKRKSNKYNNGHLLKNTKISTGIPDRMIVKLVYEGVYAATGPFIYAFRANSIYDPDYTGTGGQPLGRDQWATLYSKYRVFASKIEVKACNIDSTNATIMAIIPDNSLTLTYTTLAVSEYPRSRTFVMAPCNGGRSAIIGRHKCKINHIAGLTSTQFKGDPDWASVMGSNPINTVYWNIVFQNLESNTTATGKQQMRAKVTYYVELFDRVELTAS